MIAAGTTIGGAAPTAAGGIGDDDWLGVVNYYRAASKLAPVVENPAWSAGAVNHSCWMMLNGIAHDEAPGTPGYTVNGDEAGNSGNVAVTSYNSATARDHIELWMSGPFHAIGILRSSLSQTGFGMCESPPSASTTPWKSAATLDVVRGNNWSAPKPATPTLFPGDGSTISMDRFVSESPDPRSFCGWGNRTVGLPLIALMPNNVTAANATLSGPNGPIATCVLTKQNTSGVASSILGGDNAVVVLPAAPLAAGLHTVSVTSNGGSASWSFNVAPGADLAPVVEPDPATTERLSDPTAFHSVIPFRHADSRVGLGLTRLRQGTSKQIRIAGLNGIPKDAIAVSANITAVNPSDRGYVTASNCSSDPTSISTLNFLAGETSPNQALVPLTKGAICVYSNRDVDIVIDVNGYIGPGGNDLFMPIDPVRIIDTRTAQPLKKGSGLAVQVTGKASGVPDDARAVVVNITSADPVKSGWIRAFPCGTAPPVVSTLNPRAGSNRPNSAIVPIGAGGKICLSANVTTDVVIDVTGWFGANGQHEYTALVPVRMLDTRSNHPQLNPMPSARRLAPGQKLRLQVAGSRGVPRDAKAATLNLVAVGADGLGWVRVVPCGVTSEVSNLNLRGAPPIANGASVVLDAKGGVCLTTSKSTHVIVDITGTWS